MPCFSISRSVLCHEQKMITMKYLEDLPLHDYAGILKNKEYWDYCSAEWHYSSLEEKIKRLATFVQRGGMLMEVLNSYADDHDSRYRTCIQECIWDFLVRIMLGDEKKADIRYVTWGDRIRCLNREEIVELLTEELKRDVNGDTIRSDVETISDDILKGIEDRHHHDHPEESLEEYQHRAELWWSGKIDLW